MKNVLIILLSFFVMVLLNMTLMRSCRSQEQIVTKITVTDTVVLTKVDTVKVMQPVPYKVIQIDTVYVAKDASNDDSNDASNDDSKDVYLYETKIYKDSVLTAQLSGINATLDWYETYVPTRTEYIYSNVYIPPKRLSVGLQGGVGVTPKGLQPYIGVGVTYRLDF